MTCISIFLCPLLYIYISVQMKFVFFSNHDVPLFRAQAHFFKTKKESLSCTLPISPFHHHIKVVTFHFIIFFKSSLYIFPEVSMCVGVCVFSSDLTKQKKKNFSLLPLNWFLFDIILYLDIISHTQYTFRFNVIYIGIVDIISFER